MVSYKMVFMTLGLLAMISSSSVDAIKTVGPKRLDKRQACDFACTGNLGDCESRCSGSGVQKVLMSVCYDNTCYCGYQPS
ncbi:hypothetical protein DM01DRAFT_1334170 [Hesseltinella vesiculosa]|uniref:Invertebrate defensins family profile domain-containing protein n=1 Tax=Hesseltinella vesiculosa TaxID=101127 RepID=A0A1X2GN74_9FUNG|nr:hypothetical protein DM01DRAFT_1334170 [Hesseltinella vesiculosa]